MLPTSLLAAHVVEIPKPGKDPSQVGNYGPISLLNVDVKVYAQILANHLLLFLPQWVHFKVGFIAGREAQDNTTKALDILH